MAGVQKTRICRRSVARVQMGLVIEAANPRAPRKASCFNITHKNRKMQENYKQTPLESKLKESQTYDDNVRRMLCTKHKNSQLGNSGYTVGCVKINKNELPRDDAVNEIP